MDHSEAVEQMAAERYLLDELAPEAREAFEEHFFDCSDCALDMRVATAFVDEAKTQLPSLTKPTPFLARPKGSASASMRDRWMAWWRPVFVAPAFAALLLAFGYQNLVTFPALRASADQPSVFSVAAVPSALRGNTLPVVEVSRKNGVALPIDFSAASPAASFVSYSLELYDPNQKRVWTGTAETGEADQQIMLHIPGAMLRNGAYKLAVLDDDPHGQRTAIKTYAFEVHMTK
jgi:hypothetical protein